MKKILALGLSLLLLSSPISHADVAILNNGVKQGTAIILNCGPDGSMTCACEGKRCTIIANGGGVTTPPTLSLASLQAFGNLTFFKDYTSSQTDANADFAGGSATGTWTVTRDATTPATYTDSSGVIQYKTDTTPRWTQGFYDDQGFHAAPGLYDELASTNKIPKSAVMNDVTWTATNVTVADNAAVSPDGTSNAASLTATAGNGTVVLASAVVAQTYSVFLKRLSGTGAIQLSANGSNFYSVTLPPGGQWAKFQVRAASASQTCGIKIVTSGDSILAWGNQFETLPFASSYIPTAGVAVTRNLETLKYANTGNRTSATESFFISAIPLWDTTSANSSGRGISDTDTKARLIAYSINTANSSRPQNKPNGSDNVTALGAYSNPLTAFASTTFGVTMQATGDPNTVNYFDGMVDGTSTVDFTAPAWGTSFYVGGIRITGQEFSGIIQNIAIFSDFKSETDATAISNLMKVSIPNYFLGTSYNLLANGFILQKGNLGSISRYNEVNSFSKMKFSTAATHMVLTVFNNYVSFSAGVGFGIRVNGTDFLYQQLASAGFSTWDITGFPAGVNTIEVVNGSQSENSPSDEIVTLVTGVLFNGAANIVRPAYTKRIVIYGDSITVAGTTGTSPPLTAWSVLARNLYETEGGTIVLESRGARSLYVDGHTTVTIQAQADKIASMFRSTDTTKIVYVQMGTNDYAQNTWSAASFGSIYGDLLDRLHADLPTAIIYCQTLTSRGDEATVNSQGNIPQDFRDVVTTAVSTRSWATLVDGTTIVSYPADYTGGGGIHPSQAAQTKYAAFFEALIGM